MNTAAALDLVFLSITAALAVRGFLRGFLKEVISLAATVGGAALAIRFSGDLGLVIGGLGWDISDAASKSLAMVLIFVAVTLLGALCAKLGKVYLSVTSLTFLDRVLGIGAGVLKALALLMALYAGLSIAGPLVPDELMTQSKSLALASQVWPKIAPYSASRRLFPQDSPEIQKSEDAEELKPGETADPEGLKESSSV